MHHFKSFKIHLLAVLLVLLALHQQNVQCGEKSSAGLFDNLVSNFDKKDGNTTSTAVGRGLFKPKEKKDDEKKSDDKKADEKKGGGFLSKLNPFTTNDTHISIPKPILFGGKRNEKSPEKKGFFSSLTGRRSSWP